jgi:hypothetical protein
MITLPSFASSAARRFAWIALVVSATIGLSLGLACAMPFAALAAVAALTLPHRDAFLLVGLAWIANQAVGFGLLHYPWTADTFGWGLVILAVSLLATLGAGICASRLDTQPRVFVACAAFLAGFAIYEGLLVLVTLAEGSATEALAPNVIAEIFALNAVVFLCLIAASRLPLTRARRLPAPARSIA